MFFVHERKLEIDSRRRLRVRVRLGVSGLPVCHSDGSRMESIDIVLFTLEPFEDGIVTTLRLSHVRELSCYEVDLDHIHSDMC